MSGNLIANRYAKALLGAAGTSNEEANKLASFLAAGAELFEVPEIKKVLKSPVMPGDVKEAVLNYVAEKALAGKMAQHFVSELVAAGRVDLLPDISAAFHTMLDEIRGVAHATVTTVVSLSDAEKTSLQETLSKVFKKNLTVDNKVSPKILGGLVVEVGNFALDLSVKAKLDQLAEHAQH